MKKLKHGTFYAINGMDRTPIECDGTIALELDDGTWVELQMRQSDGDISLSASDQLVILPMASNVARVEVRGFRRRQ